MKLLKCPTCDWSSLQEFEAVRKEHESVKTEREEVKKRLSSLKQTHGPMLKKIQLINNQLEPIEAQIKTKVRTLKKHSLGTEQVPMFFSVNLLYPKKARN